jgi:hypothetical protein
MAVSHSAAVTDLIRADDGLDNHGRMVTTTAAAPNSRMLLRALRTVVRAAMLAQDAGSRQLTRSRYTYEPGRP